MALQDLLTKVSQKKNKVEEITEERVAENLDAYRNIISYWRVYPDRFIDYLCSLNPANTFHFYFYQRVYLRAVMRHKYIYCVFPRAFSKSFLAVLSLMIKAILYPRCRLFVVSGGKEQSAGILQSKLEEICTLVPALSKEIIWDTRGTRATTRQTKDSVIYTFKNGSIIQNVAASDKTRGMRFQAGLFEECVGIDGDIINEVLIPTLNVSRMINGEVDDNEVLNKSQVYVTTAGYKASYAYEKLIEILCTSVARPKDAIILGGSWRVPVQEKLLDKNFVRDLRLSGTFNDAAFDREYESKWAGAVEGAFFNLSSFDKHRKIQLAENKYSNKIGSNGYYILGVDFGRFSDTTEICVFKVNPMQGGSSIKNLVNIYTIEKEHTGMQAIKIKRIFEQYKCRAAVVDGNGVGAGLIDALVTDTVDPDTGEILYNWGLINYDEYNNETYRKYETENTVHNALYVMKANQIINSECYVYCKNQMDRGKINFLIDENAAKEKLLEKELGKKMTSNQRANYLMPYSQTSILREQLMNLVQQDTGGQNVVLKQSNSRVSKDKVSALIYGLYYCKLEEDKMHKRKKRSISDYVFFSKH